MEAPKPFQIRQFKRDDAQAVWELHWVTISHAGADAGAEFFADLRAVGEQYLDRGGDFLVGFSGEELVACGGYVPATKEEVEIRRMRVHPNHQHQGLGAALLTALEQSAVKNGYGSAYLETTIVQQPALALYRKHGYEAVRRGEKHGYTIVCLRKTLAS